MKPILLLACFILSSCATTTIFEAGKPVAVIQGDAEGLRFTRHPDGSIDFRVDNLSHSKPTLAQGQAFANKATAVGAAAAAAGITTILTH